METPWPCLQHRESPSAARSVLSTQNYNSKLLSPIPTKEEAGLYSVLLGIYQEILTVWVAVDLGQSSFSPRSAFPEDVTGYCCEHGCSLLLKSPLDVSVSVSVRRSSFSLITHRLVFNTILSAQKSVCPDFFMNRSERPIEYSGSNVSF